ncbi:MAG: PD-(D/E)XK nuclease family protein [Solirubrobacteraceae bacterium]
MPLTLILGPANSAKAGEVLGAYAAAAPRGAVLVVPTAPDVEHYRRELADQGFVLGDVLTFTQLADEIARRAGYLTTRLSRLQQQQIMRRVLARLSFQALGESAGARGFPGAATGLIAELGRTMITPQRFAAALRAWVEQDGRRAAYAQDLEAIVLGYSSELERTGWDDVELFSRRALDALRARPHSWGREPVFFYGFDDLTALELDAVETLARIVGAEVTVSLTYEPGRAALTARAEVVAELDALAARTVVLPALDHFYAPGSRPALHHVERHLFEPVGGAGGGSERIDSGEAIALLEAGGERAEAELIAAEVLALLRMDYRPEEIVVVNRSAARSAPLLEQVFRDYGIPLASERAIPLAHTTLGGAVLALARCALLEADLAPAGDLLRYLRSPGLLERPELADLLEADVHRQGLRSAAQARGAFPLRLSELDAPGWAGDPAAELVRQATRLFAAPRLGAAELLDEEGELDARALGAVRAAVCELGALGVTPAPGELLELLAELEVPVGRLAPGAVLVAEPLSIRARRFRAVFVSGLCEGEFPRPGSSEPFLSDEQRRELAVVSGMRLRTAEDSLDRERYLFYACLSRATERLVLSYRSSDEEGNLVLASPFLDDVAGLLDEGWRGRRRRRLLADVVWALDQAPTVRERECALSAEGHREGRGAGPESQLHVLSGAAQQKVRHRHVVSAGALECFSDCPVKWLIERQLEPADLEPEAEPLSRGTFMHEVLERLLAGLGGPLTEPTLPRALELLEQLLVEMPLTLAQGRPPAIRQAALRSARADLRRYLRQEAADSCAFTARWLELRFGIGEGPDELPAIELGEGPDRLRVRGVIDRVDLDPAGSGQAIVRDYKSASSRSDQPGARWQRDRRLQVALYMVAVRELLGLDPVAGFYQPLGGGELRPRGVFRTGAPVGDRISSRDARAPQELEEMLADACHRAVEITRELRAGRLDPRPVTCSRDGCRYPGLCRGG